ncbi:YfiR/HmsC family protein [Paraglaciecola aquimarina]|uniref:histidine kinase n=1 Tax=Paraglaciecola algarum TaxID=3050085 RepID=A0ABS9DC39_9ALTE|nr:YfiR/HmsC family protein [Paraglaciecola sp. G1-23]MCF2950299.1 YfiR/HmsC family protein [Paraglaciecola sp. G1-23]
MKNKMRLILIICTSLILNSSAICAQKINEDKVKAVFIFNFMKHTSWPNETSKNFFTIATYQDQTFHNTLVNLLTDKKVKNKPIKFISADSLDDTKRAEVVVIPESLNDNLEQIAFELRRSETLLITHNALNKKDVMINFVQNLDTNNLSFEINKSNLIYEKLVISNELLLLGGTELDVATLYRETELAMQKTKLRESKLQQNIASLQEQLSLAANNLENSKTQLTENNIALKQRELAIQKQNTELKNQQSKLTQLQNLFLEKEKELIEISKQRNIALSQSQKQLEQKIIDVQQKEGQIANLGTIISQNKAEIDQQLAQLKKQRAEISNKDQTIKSKNTYLAYTAIFIIIVSMFTLLVVFLFIRNRKVTAQLQDTLKNLEDTQSQLVQSEKMASLGLLTAGISHEINTPIGIVVTSLSVIQDRAKELTEKITENKLTKSKLTGFMNDIAQSAEVSNKSLTRVITLISNFKQVAVDHVIEEPRELNLVKYINELLDTLSSQLKKKGIHYQAIEASPMKVMTIPGALAQVLTNLVTNTISHAFPETIINKRQAKIEIQVLEDTADRAIIKFFDNGCGMKQEILDKIYEPFYTTKRSEGGTGLGMNIVYNIVLQKLNGTIDIQSTENIGTTISITLPKTIS